MVRLSPIERQALDDFASRVRAALGPRALSVTLFGSRARGEGRDDSDLDVLVLVRDLDSTARRVVQDAGFDVSLATGLVVSPVSADEARWWPELPLAKAVACDGVAL